MVRDSDGSGRHTDDAIGRRKIRVLVLEDSSIDAEINIRELRQAGFDPEWQRVGTESDFRAALDNPLDLILADYSLPQFDGIRAVDLVRERGLDTPFILISGMSGEEFAVTAIKRGADDYLLKDRLARLGSAVTSALGMKVLRDERRQTEEAVRESEARYRLISENTADVIWTFDIRSTRVTYVSPSVQRALGRTPKEVTAGGIEDLLEPGSLSLVLGKLEAALGAFAAGDGESVRIQTMEVEFLHRNGSLVSVEMVTTIVSDDQGRPATVLGVSRDLTERRHAEAAVRQNAERLTALRELGQRSFATEEELIEGVLQEKLEITHSGLAFFHLVADDQVSIRAFRWSYDSAATERDAHLDRADLWTDCLRTRQARVRNERLPASGASEDDRRNSGIARSMCVPVLDGGRLVAIAGVGNRDSEYDETEALRLQLFMDQVWKLIVRRRSEQALEVSEEKYRRIVETANEGIWIIGKETGTTYVNRRMAEMLGYSPGEMMGRPLEAFMTEEARHISDRNAERRKAGIEETHDFELRRKDGSSVWTVMATSPLLNQSGEYEGALAMVTDISALRHSDEERRLLAAAIEQAAEAIVITDTDARIQYVNPAFTVITGYTFTEAIGQTPRLLKSGRQPPEFYRQMWGTLLDGKVWSGRLINRRKDGTEYVQDTTISPVRDAAGTTSNYVAVSRDITEIAALEAQLRHAQKIEAVGVLAGGVAHDFNNLLQALLSQIQSLRRQANSQEKVAGVVAQIEQQVMRGASLTRQLLLFARREVTKQERFDLSDAVRGTLDMLRHLVRENVSFQVDLAAEPLPVEGDRGEIDQVLTNLVVNASHAMPDGGQIAIRTALDPSRGALLIVADTGHGIPEAVRQKIFEPFFTTKTGEHGTGLGLSVVHGIVTKQGGGIDVQSSSAGTTFTIVLPLATAAASEETATPLSEAVLQEGAHERILLVEDEDGAREGLVLILDSLNYDVTAVATGEEAESLAAQSPPFEVLLTDLTLPGMSGKELALRLTERWPGLHVILMSGYTEDTTIQTAGGDRKVHFLQKPFDMDALAAELHAVLGPAEITRAR